MRSGTHSLMKLIRIFFILTCLQPSLLKAQYFEIDFDPDEFGIDIANGLELIQTESAKKLAYDFKALWLGSRITNAQKDTIILITQKMRERRLRTRPFFEYFFTYIVYAINNTGLESRDYSKLLEASLAATNSYSTKKLSDLFLTLNHIFARGRLYSSNYYTVDITEGAISFDYIAPIDLPPPIAEDLIAEEDEFLDDDWGQETDDGWGTDTSESDDDWATNEDDSWVTTDNWDTYDNTDSANDSGWDAWDNNEDDGTDTWEAEPQQPVRQIIEPVTTVRTINNQQPILSGPIIRFANASFLMVTPYDSVSIENTSGELSTDTKTFVGNGGVFHWPKGIKNTEEVSAEFSDYNFQIDVPYINAKESNLTYPSLTSDSVKGDFVFKSTRRTPLDPRRYPQFRSYESEIQLTLQAEDLRYQGGLSIMGSELYGANYWDDYSTIIVDDNKGQSFKAISTNFIFLDSLIRAKNTQIAIYHDGDSISHPIVRFDYEPSKKLMTLLKEDGGYKHTQYYSSFFRMNFNADMVRWDLNSDSIDVSVLLARHRVPAVFESDEYFNEERYAKYSGLWGFHPVTMVVNFARIYHTTEFYLSELMIEYKIDPKFAEVAMIYLEQNSFIDFDEKTKGIKVLLKAFHYNLSNWKRKDYDNILISSISEKAVNATFKLDSSEMVVRGVEKIYVTPELDVFIEPDSGYLKLQQNRSFEFDGSVTAGDFVYKGKDFQFSYQDFLINMPAIDSIRIQVNFHDSTNNIGDEKVGLHNHISETSGTLYINSPNNKAGLKRTVQFPYFVTTSQAVVYFDDPNVLEGAYDKSIRFVIPPMQMDSLVKDDYSKISFPGTFMAGGILPPFQDTLQILPDKSMGFRHNVPPEGYALYEGSGKLYNEVHLDGNGLRSNGHLQYISTTIQSDDFVFYMDSVTAIGNEGEIVAGTFEGGSYPQATIGHFKMKWLPQKDSMYIANRREPFQFYNSTAQLDGEANITASGMFGSGQLTTRGSISQSDELTFRENDYSAWHADFKILTDVPDKPAMEGDDISLNFDLIANVADIHPEQAGVAAIGFPYAQMKTSITNAVWDLTAQTISMTKPETVPIENSYFYTTRKDLDSLAFNASSATYDINTFNLDIKGIPWIIVADAKIIPEGHRTTILENATLQPFANAEIIIDTLNEYHYLDQGHITILSRNKFEGNAQYKVPINSDTFSIQFNEFNLVQVPIGKKGFKTMTVSGGVVPEDEPILISPGILYKGSALMFADRPTLELKGFVKLDLKKPPNYRYWIIHDHNPEEDEVIFDFETSQTEQFEPLTAGLFYKNDLLEIYPSFLDHKINDPDDPFFEAKGLIKYDTLLKAFKIEEILKETGESYAGRTFIYDENNQTMIFEGPVQFLHNEKFLRLEASAIGSANIDSSRYDIDAFMVFDMDLHPDVVNAMNSDVIDIIERIGALEAHNIELEVLMNLANLTNDETAKSYESASLADYVELVNVAPLVLGKTMAFSNVKMSWSQRNQAWYNTSKLGLSNIMTTDINAKVDGFIEIKNDRNLGQIIKMFVMIAPSTWYFFHYEDSQLEMFSSNPDFNTAVTARSNIDKAGFGQFATLIGDEIATLEFINKFRERYFGIDEPFDLQMPMDTFVEDEEFDTILKEDDDDGF